MADFVDCLETNHAAIMEIKVPINDMMAQIISVGIKLTSLICKL